MGATKDCTTMKDLYLDGVTGIREITKFNFHIEPEKHATAKVQAIGNLSETKEWIYGQLNKKKVAVKSRLEEEPIFSGIISSAGLRVKGMECFIELELISGSSLLDLAKESRSYQDCRLTYRQIMKEVMAEIQGAEMISGEFARLPVNQPVIQYLETPWEFLSRLSSHKNQPLIPDIRTNGEPRIYIGLPYVAEKAVAWEDHEVEGYGSGQRFFDLGGFEEGLALSDFVTYDIRGHQNYHVGQRGVVKGREVVIFGVDAKGVRGELVYTYHAAPERFVYKPKRYNQKISGMSLLGTVISRDGEDVWLHLDIDGGRATSDKHPWSWTPPTGNMLYLMPSIGSKISLYFSSGDERSGKGINCIRENGKSMGNPSDRRLRTEHGKSLNLTTGKLSLESEHDGGLSIRMSSGNVHLGGESCSISGKAVSLRGANINLQFKGELMEAGHGPSINNSGDQIEVKTLLKLESKDNGSINIRGKTKTEVTAESSTKTYEAYPDAPEEGSYNFAASAQRAAMAVLVISGGAVIICATNGAAAPAVLEVGLGSLAATSTAVVGLSLLDYVNGSVSSQEDYMAVALADEMMYLTNKAAGLMLKKGGSGAGKGGSGAVIINTSKNSPEFGELNPIASLNKRQRKLLESLSKPGATVTLRKNSVSMNDLLQLTNVTGDEFNMFTLKGERLIIRGQGNKITVSRELYNEIIGGSYRFSGHTHPPGYSIEPGPSDGPFLRDLGQQRSGIWGTGKDKYGNSYNGGLLFGSDSLMTDEIRREFEREIMRKLYGSQ